MDSITLLIKNEIKSQYKSVRKFSEESGIPYNPEIATSVRRRYSYSITDNEMVKTRKTHVGNMNYIVNSIFDMNSKKKVEDHIRRLIAIDIQDI